jgi:NADPH:quinone reductase-like Zn-dependent oxidoreductase
VIALDCGEIGPAVKDATGGKGAYCALDAVGGDQAGEMLSSLREGGNLILYSEHTSSHICSWLRTAKGNGCSWLRIANGMDAPG